MNETSFEQARIDGATRLYGIVGHPIEQVKSPGAFNPRFKARGQNAVLVPLDVPPESFETAMRGLMALANLGGIVITVPYKMRALALVDEVLPTGRTVGAINAMRRGPDGRWSGDMFDGAGLIAGLAAEGVAVTSRRALLIGAGGAGSAVAVAFANAGAKALTIHDLDHAKAEGLAVRAAAAFPACAVRVGAPAAQGHDVVVNATPVGMAAGDGLPAEIGALDPAQLVIDIIAKPEVTPLLAMAQALGCRTFGGKTMLSGQLAELERFFGIGE